MPAGILDRRQFLFGTTALVATAGAMTVAGPLRADCAALHARVAAEFGGLVRSATFAAGNIHALVMDVVCPCCGQPLFDFG